MKCIFLVGFILWTMATPNKGQAQAPIHESDFRHLEVVDLGKVPQLTWGDLSPIYAEILREFQNQYQIIGEREARRVLERQNGFYLGGFNNIGFSYAKKFAHFDVNIERQIAPDLFDDRRHIVTDKFHILIDASKLFSNLRDDGVINMTDAQLGLFAGVVFKRTYRYIHFASSYEEGLVFDLNKMFLSFNLLRDGGYLNLSPYEIIQREDYLSAAVGGVVMAPVTTGIAVSAGAMARWHQLHKIEIQAVGPEDQQTNQERLRLSFEKSKNIDLMGTLGVHAEFLRFLRFTLLSYDFTYSLQESQTTHLSFNQRAVNDLRRNTLLASEVERLLAGRLNVDMEQIAPFVVSHEQRIQERMNSKYMVLIFGGLRDQRTEQIRLVRDNIMTTYFRHNFEKVTFVENFLSRLISTLFKSYLQLNTLVNHAQSETKRMTLEYRAERNLLDLKQELPLANGQNILTLSFEKDFYAQKINKQSYNRLDQLIGHYSGIDPLVSSQLGTGIFQKNLKLKSNYTVDQKGVEYLNKIAPQQIVGMVRALCDGHSRTLWDAFRNLFGVCRNKLNNAYDLYYLELNHRPYTITEYNSCKTGIRFYWTSGMKQAFIQKCIEAKTVKTAAQKRNIPLWRLRDLAQGLHEESDNKIDVIHFFGLQNVFLHGSFHAETPYGPFVSHFNEGRFRSLGAVDQFMREQNVRSPASVVVD